MRVAVRRSSEVPPEKRRAPAWLWLSIPIAVLTVREAGAEGYAVSDHS